MLENGALKVTKTGNADLPLKHGQTALLTVDVWEHAYYIDYRNLRPKYVETFLGSLVNWDFVAENYAEGQVERPLPRTRPRRLAEDRDGAARTA